MSATPFAHPGGSLGSGQSRTVPAVCATDGRASQRAEVVRPTAIAAAQGVSRVERFSPRLLQLAELMVRGASNKEIAREIGITEATVKVHAKTAFKLAGVSNRTQMAVWWMQGGRELNSAPSMVWDDASVDTLKRLIAAGLEIDAIQKVFDGRANDEALALAVRLLRPDPT